MRVRVRQLLVAVAGWVFLLIGVVGLFVPILQGVLFILVGLSILSKSSRRVRRLLDSLRKRFPTAFHRAEGFTQEMLDRLRAIWSKIIRWVTL
ncbi:MAG TPA: PGPGW domain-containing protein [Nitrospiria bacterium]|nr:PGPGW domain-containing protein [Nitrospiria bacterium]